MYMKNVPMLCSRIDRDIMCWRFYGCCKDVELNENHQDGWLHRVWSLPASAFLHWSFTKEPHGHFPLSVTLDMWTWLRFPNWALEEADFSSFTCWLLYLQSRMTDVDSVYPKLWPNTPNVQQNLRAYMQETANVRMRQRCSLVEGSMFLFCFIFHFQLKLETSTVQHVFILK